jgi:hypothetical protein
MHRSHRNDDLVEVIVERPEKLRPKERLETAVLQQVLKSALRHGISPFLRPYTVVIEALAGPSGLRWDIADLQSLSIDQPARLSCLCTSVAHLYTMNVH